MPAFLIPAILSGISALAGGLSNRSSTQQQSGQSTNYSNTNPVLSEGQGFLQEALLNKYIDSLMGPNADPNLTGYTNSQVAGINKGSDVQQRAIQESLAARGIVGGPMSDTALLGENARRLTNISQFKAGVPLLQRQLNTDMLNTGMNLFKSLPYGTSSFSQTNQQGTVNEPGNVAGGTLGNLANILAFLQGQRSLGSSNGSGGYNTGGWGGY